MLAWALVTLAATFVEPFVARADVDEGPSDDEILPPDPATRDAVTGIEIRFVLPFPAYAEPLCPRSATCIVGVGGGFGIFLERRFQGGFALGGGYELGLQSAEAVYELTTLQSFGARGRWVMRPTAGGHPVFEVGFGAIALGDVFRFETIGPYLDLGFGGELEMTESLAFTLGFRARTMAFVPFTTRLDGVERSVSPYVDVLVVLHAGITWIAPRAEAR